MNWRPNNLLSRTISRFSGELRCSNHGRRDERLQSRSYAEQWNDGSRVSYGPRFCYARLHLLLLNSHKNGAIGTRVLEFLFHSRPDLVNIRSIDEAVIIALSLSSSAFLLQLLAENAELPTSLGSATLGILLRNQCNKYKCSFYEGVIDCYFTRKKKHQVIYADGDLEELNLIEERWKLLKDDTSGDADVYLPECLPLSDIQQRQKVEKSKNSCHVCGTCYFLWCKILQ